MMPPRSASRHFLHFVQRVRWRLDSRLPKSHPTANSWSFLSSVAPCGITIPQCPPPAPPLDPKNSFRRRVLHVSLPDRALRAIGSGSICSERLEGESERLEDGSEKPEDELVMVPLNTDQGRQMLIDSLVGRTAASYIALTEHSMNQCHPSYCAVTSLVVVLNAFHIDPLVVRWQGGWRYFANEHVLLSLHPCLPSAHIDAQGVTLEQFHRLATCQGLRCVVKRPLLQPPADSCDRDSFLGSLADFRDDVIRALSEPRLSGDPAETFASPTTISSPVSNPAYSNNNQLDRNDDAIVVVSFGRQALHQTGEGHYSPIGAYHRGTDTVLLLDVARFKYQPFWVSVQALYSAMTHADPVTGHSRGWFVLQPPPLHPQNPPQSTHQHSQSSSKSPQSKSLPTYFWKSSIVTDEGQIPAHLVPLASSSPHTSSKPFNRTNQNNNQAGRENNSFSNNPCPVHSFKVNYCSNNIRNNTCIRSRKNRT